MGAKNLADITVTQYVTAACRGVGVVVVHGTKVWETDRKDVYFTLYAY